MERKGQMPIIKRDVAPPVLANALSPIPRPHVYPKFLHNDYGAPEVGIDAKEFECIGATPPHDHPHIYISMGGSRHDSLSLLRNAIPVRAKRTEVDGADQVEVPT